MYDAIIYPYDNSNKEIIKNINQKLYKVQGIVSPKGWGFCGERIVEKGIDCYVEDCITKIKSSYNSVYILDSRFPIETIPSFENLLRICKEKNLKVIWCRKSTDAAIEKVQEYISNENIQIISNPFHGIKKRKIFDINIPVVFITDMFSEMNSIDTRLKILNEIKKRGYKVKLVTGRKDMTLIEDVFLIPDDFFDINISNENKIINFNHYIKSVEKELDLILIDIPGNVIEVSKDIIGDFGCGLFMISRTLIPDYVVCNMPYIDMMEEKTKMLEKFVEKRLESSVDAYTIIPQYFDLVNSESFQEMDYTELSIEFVNKRVGNLEKIYFLQNDVEIVRIVDRIISKLEGYRKIVNV